MQLNSFPIEGFFFNVKSSGTQSTRLTTIRLAFLGKHYKY